MIFRCFQVLFLCLLSLITFSQSVDTLFKDHNFTKHIGSYPVQKRWFISEHLYSEVEVKGIPESIDSFRVYTLDFNYTHTLYLRKIRGSKLTVGEERYLANADPSLLIDQEYEHYMYAVGGLRKGRKVILFDTNRDGDFFGERIFEFPWYRDKYITGDSTPYAFEVDRFTKVDNTEGNSLMLCYEIFDGNSVVPSCFHYEVQANYDMVPNPAYPSEIEWYDFHFMLLKSEYVKTLVEIKDARFNIYLIPGGNGYRSCSAFIQNLDSESMKPRAIQEVLDTLIPGKKMRFDMSHDGLTGSVILMDKEILDSMDLNLFDVDYSLRDVLKESENLHNISLSTFNLLHFFGTWCGPCKSDFPRLKALADNNPSLNLVGIASEHQVNFSALRDLKQKYKLDWDILVDNKLLGEDTSLAVQLGIHYYPSYLLIDKEGNTLLVSHDLSEIIDYRFE